MHRLLLFLLIASTSAIAQQPTALVRSLLAVPGPAPRVADDDDNVAPRVVDDARRRASDAPPDDDAPITDLVVFWFERANSYSNLRYTPKPSPRTIERLLEHVREKRELLGFLLRVLPPDKNVIAAAEEAYDEYLRLGSENPRLREWLKFNSTRFVAELERGARRAHDEREYVTNQRELLALARLDWDRAAPIVESLQSDPRQPVSAVLANWALYARALQRDDGPDIDKYRRKLQDVVENRRATAGERDLAFDALVSERDWDGRDDWYFSLFEDETLLELRVNGRTYTGLTTVVLYSPPGRFTRRIAELLRSPSDVVRRMALSNLIAALGNRDAEAARALLPLLSDKSETAAALVSTALPSLIQAASDMDIPDSVPYIADAVGAGLTPENIGLAMDAVTVFNKYRDPRALPVLRRLAAMQLSDYLARNVYAAIDACGGVTDEEKARAVEALAVHVAAEPKPAGDDSDAESANPIFLTARAALLPEAPPDAFARLVLGRLAALKRRNPPVAAALEGLIEHWESDVVDADRLARLSAGDVVFKDLARLIGRRNEIRERNATGLATARDAGGLARGISVCLAARRDDVAALLVQPDALAKAATLACARIVRLKIDVAAAAALLGDRDPLVAAAAEAYLESEDSPNARRAVLSRHSNEAWILGARRFFAGAGKLPEAYKNDLPRLGIFADTNNLDANIVKFEEKLRKDVQGAGDVEAVYALLTSANDRAALTASMMRGGGGVLRFHDDESRFYERILTAEEATAIRRAFEEERLDDAIPSWRGSPNQEIRSEFLVLTKAGGRRVYFAGQNTNPRLDRFAAAFMKLADAPMKLRYAIADKVPDLEVLHADKDASALAVWKDGTDLRVYVENMARRREIRTALAEQREAERNAAADSETDDEESSRLKAADKREFEARFEPFEWRAFEGGALGGGAPAPPDLPFFGDARNRESFDVKAIRALDGWQRSAGGRTVAVGWLTDGIQLSERGGDFVSIARGRFDRALITPDGAWAAALSYATSPRGWKPSVRRFDLARRREVPVALPPASTYRLIAYVPAHRSFVAYAGPDEPAAVIDLATAKGACYLIDAATGASTKLDTGEFRPLSQQTYRPLQPTGRPNEFWAAIYDEKTRSTRVGRYDAAKFEFTPTTVLPEIALTSMDIWVDEAEAKIYIVYEGHLLRVPLGR